MAVLLHVSRSSARAQENPSPIPFQRSQELKGLGGWDKGGHSCAGAGTLLQMLALQRRFAAAHAGEHGQGRGQLFDRRG